MEPGTFAACVAMTASLFLIVRRHVNHLYQKAGELTETTHNQQRQIDELKHELEELRKHLP